MTRTVSTDNGPPPRCGQCSVPNPRPPWDVVVIAVLHFALAALLLLLGLLLALGIAHYLPSEAPSYTLYSLYGLAPKSWNTAVMFFGAGVVSLTAYGLLRRRALGWWLLLVTTADGLPNCIVYLTERPVVSWLNLLLAVAIFAWLTYRWRMYNPSHSKIRGEK